MSENGVMSKDEKSAYIRTNLSNPEADILNLSAPSTVSYYEVNQVHSQKTVTENKNPLEYFEETRLKNCVGLMTKAAANITMYNEPRWVDPKLPKLYEIYATGKITSGLEAVADGFYLNGKAITLYAGAMHYFRVHPRYWRDRLRRMRACGLNCVDTFIPWNLHEPEKDHYDFGEGDNDLSLFADLASFLRVAQEEDLLVIVRPGPFINAEWEFGGLPSWLLRIPSLKIRTSEVEFMSRVEKYFTHSLGLLRPFQFQRGGPIIAVQIENEYGSVMQSELVVDRHYIPKLHDLIIKNGITEMLFTSTYSFYEDDVGSLEGVLMATSFQSNPIKELNALKNRQPDKPCFVIGFWTGWFDHWTHLPSYNSLPLKEFTEVTETIMKYPASLNFYMFHGGTNWGFMNGANVEQGLPLMVGYRANTTTYDTDAPISEGGDYNEKYMRAQQLIRKYNTVRSRLPRMPPLEPKISYLAIPIKDHLSFSELINRIPPELTVESHDLVSMEHLDINNGNGQSYGYILYRKRGVTIHNGDVLKIMGHVRDIAIVMIDGVTVTKKFVTPEDKGDFGFWYTPNSEKTLSVKSGTNRTIDILVENFGRASYGLLSQLHGFKGLVEGNVLLNDDILYQWEITAVEFKSAWVKSLGGFTPIINATQTCPGLYHATLELNAEPMDTWLDMQMWIKGFVFVNGYNLGRYLTTGPPITLYCPAAFLHKGKNEILVFEHYQFQEWISFSDKPLLQSRKKIGV